MDTFILVIKTVIAGFVVFGTPAMLIAVGWLLLERHLDRKDAIRWARSRHPAGTAPYPHSNVRVIP